MCERCGNASAHHALPDALPDALVGRRSIFRLAAGAAAGFALAPSAFAANDKTPPQPGNVVTPDAALHRLMEGNTRYVKGDARRHDFSHEREALSKGQNPFAAV